MLLDDDNNVIKSSADSTIKPTFKKRTALKPLCKKCHPEVTKISVYVGDNSETLRSMEGYMLI